MRIEVDTELLFKYNITPNQFILIYLISNESKVLKDFINLVNKDELKKDLEVLEKVNFIHNLNTDNKLDFSNIVVRDEFLNLINLKVDLFQELLDIYPIKVRRPDGFYDYLKTDSARSRKRYNQLIRGNRLRHHKIIEALKYELKIRQKEGSMMYMKRLPKWLSSREWEVFEERMKDEEKEVESIGTYGTNIE
ncbi:MAG TPA: hypothetical protein VJ881_03385 [Halanaerobiales bacterium]|nr:hypothetical protein [Halanaerobiales bacterium]